MLQGRIMYYYRNGEPGYLEFDGEPLAILDKMTELDEQNAPVTDAVFVLGNGMLRATVEGYERPKLLWHITAHGAASLGLPYQAFDIGGPISREDLVSLG